jgi:diguanylate cyclase (GGDEF)-like protein
MHGDFLIGSRFIYAKAAIFLALDGAVSGLLMTTEADARQAERSFTRRVLVPVIAVTCGAALLAAAGLSWVAARNDAVATERETREIRNAVGERLDALARSQQRVAISDETIAALRSPEPDWRWVDEHMAFWLHDLFGHDRFFILDAQDQPIYAAHGRKRQLPARYASAQPALQPLIDKARGRLQVAGSVHDRLPDQPLAPGSSVETGEGVVHATELISLMGQPAAASVMAVMPSSEGVQDPPGSEPLIVSVQFLDKAVLENISRQHLIEAPRFAETAQRHAGEQALALSTAAGSPVGFILWRAELPGTRQLRAAAPIIALAGAVLLGMMALLARLLYRSRERQHVIMAELQASEAQAHHLAIHDVLTGLPNRAMFNNRLDQALGRQEPATVLLIDLDRLRTINDALGPSAGDTLIRQFGERLVEIARGEHLVARIGGDKFALLCCGREEPGSTAELCRCINEAARRPYDLSGVQMTCSVSIGVSSSGAAPANRSDLLRKADVALYRAKAEGRDCTRTFTREMDESINQRTLIEGDLREALATGEGLMVHYQPQIACGSQSIVGLEALIRWRHPARGMVMPQQFIAIAEEAGLISQLGEWVLHQACLTSRRWPDLFMAVNFSPLQFRAHNFAERVIGIVEETGADPAHIELEVTESVLLDDDDLVHEAFDRLRGHGFRVSLDDFGTGYSSLSYLRRFQVDKLKIDRSFVQPLSHSGDAAAIVSAVLTLGHALGLTVTAEGVETLEQHRFLATAGCDIVQGYLFSPPVPEEQIPRMIAAPTPAQSAA